MSTEITSPGSPPEWDLADRMRKALRSSGVSSQEMADYLDVDRSTVSTWINGRIEPSTQTQRLWALRTGVPFEWIQTGDSGSPSPNPAPTGPYLRESSTLRDRPIVRRLTPVPARQAAA